MKILWLTNVILPLVSRDLDIQQTVYAGWLDYVSRTLLNKGVQMVFLSPCESGPLVTHHNDRYSFYSFDGKDRQKRFYDILKNERPDLIHIWGTEFIFSYDLGEAASKCELIDRVVISIQGLVYYYGRYHYYANLPSSVVYSFSLRDLFKFYNLKIARDSFLKRGEYEKRLLKKASNVIGRTDWDKACTTQINPQVNYFHCNEALRDAFYRNEWRYDHCEKHTIFVSQSSYPIKGFHFVIEALRILTAAYPDVHVYTTGRDLLTKSVGAKLKFTTYQLYLRKLIEKYNLQDKITFLGQLSEEEMCEQYLKSHVFVSASSIENSPNSLGEAMLLGVPSVSSDVGGVKNMFTHEIDGYIYQSDAPYMLAYYVCQIFDSKEKAMTFSKESREHALRTHNRDVIISRIISIYSKISCQESF